MTTDSLGFHGQANAATQVLANEAAHQREAAALQLANQQAQQANKQMLEHIQLLMSTVLQAATTKTNNQTQRINGGGGTRGNRCSTGRGCGTGRARPKLPPPAYTAGLTGTAAMLVLTAVTKRRAMSALLLTRTPKEARKSASIYCEKSGRC